MVNAIQVLADYFEHGGGDASGKRLDALFGGNAAFLLKTGIFGPASGHAEAPCRCQEGDHAAKVVWNGARRAYRARCPKGDRYWMEPADVETHAFNAGMFGTAVCEAFGVVPRKGRSLPESAVQYSGDSALGETRFPVFLVRNMHSPDTIDAVLDLDRRKIGHSRGVFLCAALPAETLRRHSFHAFVTFCDVLDLQDAALRRRPDGVRRALGDAIRTMVPAERAAQLKTIAEQYRQAFGDWPSVRGLADLAAAEWPEDQKPPGKTKCEEVLKQMRASAN